MPARTQRVAAYAVVVRDGEVLLSRLAPRVSRHELWTLPGGGLEHGEDPRDAVVREVREETGLDVTVGPTARTYSLHLPDTWRKGRRVDAHSLRIVYDGWVAKDAPAPQVQEVDGSTSEAAWKPVADVLDGTVPTVALVKEALEGYRPVPHQRLAAFALVRQHGRVLLTRISPLGYGSGDWTLPGGGVDHGEDPRDTVRRELREECSLDGEVGEVVAVHDVHVRGTGPGGRDEDFHSIHLVFAATVPDGAEPVVHETGGTTDAAAWVDEGDIGSAEYPVNDLVRAVLGTP